MRGNDYLMSDNLIQATEMMQCTGLTRLLQRTLILIGFEGILLLFPIPPAQAQEDATKSLGTDWRKLSQELSHYEEVADATEGARVWALITIRVLPDRSARGSIIAAAWIAAVTKDHATFVTAGHVLPEDLFPIPRKDRKKEISFSCAQFRAIFICQGGIH